MTHTKKSTIIAAGFAMFSMFFGAGNIVFPLALGKIAQNNNFFAIVGMLLTGVCVPFCGLLAMTLFDGDYRKFFGRIGEMPGFIVAACIMGLIGPFGAIPRCIALSFSTAKGFLPEDSSLYFSLGACIIIFLFTFRRNCVVEVIGYFLTPILLCSLAIIVIMGLWNKPEQKITNSVDFSLFFKGLVDGYMTMDLLGAFFFSSVVIAGLKSLLPSGGKSAKSLLTITLKASLIGGGLLALTYIGFSYVAAFHHTILKDVPPDELISAAAAHVLGPYASIVASIAVAFACLTTAIALAAVFAEFLKEDIFLNKIGYIPCLIGTLVIAFFISTLNFKGIAAFLEPVLMLCYPSLMALTLFNILYKIYGIKMVKVPVFATFLLSLGYYLYSL